ncbi:Hypothetical protein, conserved [Brucella melitensis ATCC 23457]|uniref:Uncharacterized protein n=1 Tax=Brucella melitensis biotype 2 (strain ATCC 23457) TaxID=546272 RepID=C0RGQ8_BRUMB|nr:Hypothetical protein, conserved [Brucella melitensis ATCC 23457]
MKCHVILPLVVFLNPKFSAILDVSSKPNFPANGRNPGRLHHRWSISDISVLNRP